MSSEADTCRKWVTPKLQAAGWDNDPHSIAGQRNITDEPGTIHSERSSITVVQYPSLPAIAKKPRTPRKPALTLKSWSSRQVLIRKLSNVFIVWPAAVEI